MFGIKSNRNVDRNLLESIYTELENENYTHAIDLSNRGIENEPRNILYRRYKAQALISLDMPDEAIQELKIAEKLEPENPKILIDEAGCYNHMENSDEALKLCNRVIEMDPELNDAYYVKGIALRSMGRHSDAVVQFKKYIKQDPSDANAHLDLGETYEDMGRYGEGANEAKIALRYEKDSEDAYDLLLRCAIKLKSKRFDPVKIITDAYLDTENFKYMRTFLEIEISEGDPSRAIEILDLLRDYDPDNVEIVEFEADVFYDMGDKEKARKIYMEFVEDSDYPDDAISDFVEYLMLKKDADGIMEIADSSDLSDAKKDYYRSIACISKNDPENGLKFIKKSIEESPGNEEDEHDVYYKYFDYIDFLEQLGRYDEAIEIGYKNLDQDDADVMFLMLECYIMGGRYTESIDYIKNALKESSGDSSVLIYAIDILFNRTESKDRTLDYLNMCSEAGIKDKDIDLLKKVFEVHNPESITHQATGDDESRTLIEMYRTESGKFRKIVGKYIRKNCGPEYIKELDSIVNNDRSMDIEDS